MGSAVCEVQDKVNHEKLDTHPTTTTQGTQITIQPTTTHLPQPAPNTIFRIDEGINDHKKEELPRDNFLH